MKVFKFGGSSVKNAESVKNVASILEKFKDGPVMVIMSALGKTTNVLEKLTDAYFYNTGEKEAIFRMIEDFHFKIIDELFESKSAAVYSDIKEIFEDLKVYISGKPAMDYDREYDQIVSRGELLSTKIVSNYLSHIGINNECFDVRDLIVTDNSYREGKVNWELTTELCRDTLLPYFKHNSIAISQGFIAKSEENLSITLGREGSDFTAAIFGFALDAEEVIIWKDVPGLLNADPKYFKDTSKYDQISFRETIELAYYGATIIHPKTIKPLQNKKIPLRVKSFIDPGAPGTLIYQEIQFDDSLPSYIFKVNQALLSITPKDFSFVAEKNLCFIFGLFSKYGIKINAMQNSAISFSVCFDYNENKLKKLIKELNADYSLLYNYPLELITIRHYNDETINKVLKGRDVVLEQRSRSTIQLVVNPFEEHLEKRDLYEV